MNDERENEAPMTVTGSVAGDLVSQGATLMRIENETMLAVAVQRPRDESKIVRDALRELDLVPEEAGKAYYSIPYRERQPDGTVKIVKVEGPSIKAAMALARRFGNCTVGCRPLGEDGEGWDLEGVFIDYETNFRVARPFRVPKTMRRRDGRTQVLPVDRQMMALQAGASKAMRNAVLAALPAYLVSAYDKKARAIVGGDPDAKAEPKQIEAVLRTFQKKFSITTEQLEHYTEMPVAEWTGTEIADLRGLWNALNDGQTTVEEVFSVKPETGNVTNAPSGAAVLTPDSLLSGQATGENNAPPKSADPAKAAGPKSPAPAQSSLADF